MSIRGGSCLSLLAVLIYAKHHVSRVKVQMGVLLEPLVNGTQQENHQFGGPLKLCREEYSRLRRPQLT